MTYWDAGRAFNLDPQVTSLCNRIHQASGRAVIVGGSVRDCMLGVTPKDIDIEVFGLDIDHLERVLSQFGTVLTVGRAFGVLRVQGFDIDFSLPRRDSKVGEGHKGFTVQSDPNLDFAEAAKRRDLTINSMGVDVATGELLDPHGGERDLANKRLRATSALHFAEDPLRGVRVAQFAARFVMQPDDELLALCKTLDLSQLSAERIFEEFRKLLLKGQQPSLGFEFLRQTELLRFFPELQAMVGVPQDPTWHPEGDVWVHTMMVIDEAAKLRRGDAHDDMVLMVGALCHDLGKPHTTFDDGQHIRSPSHDTEGVALAERFLARLAAPKDLIAKVARLTEHHLAPALFIKNGATARGYRRLARKLGEVGLTMDDLVRVARADHLGRTTAEALAKQFPAGDEFLRQARELAIEHKAPVDIVMGRHLIERGFAPGPEFGRILQECREKQDESGWTDADLILSDVLSRRQSG